MCFLKDGANNSLNRGRHQLVGNMFSLGGIVLNVTVEAQLEASMSKVRISCNSGDDVAYPVLMN
jgi:hypothetical protein